MSEEDSMSDSDFELIFKDPQNSNLHVIIPMASEEDKKEGWTLSCDFLQDLADKATNFGGFKLELEEVESVLLALLGIKQTVCESPDVKNG